MDFDETTEFDYDYWNNTVLLGTELETSYTTFFHAGFGYTTKSIPDTTEISYRAFTPHLEFRKYLGLYKQQVLLLSGERRLYTHKPARSPFWSIVADIDLSPFSRGSFGIAFENSLESYIYDKSSDIYYSYVEDRTALLITYQRYLDLQLRVGPTYAFFTSSVSKQDRYKEIGGKIAFEYFKGAKIWLSVSYEPGWRFYEAFDENTRESIFSGFMINRVIFFTTVRIWKQMSINGFLDFEPERHERKGDDSTITLLSLSLAYNF